MDVSTTQLKIFSTVAEHCNFTRAAGELYMTQPAVSAAISKLEQSFGVKLFDQLGKRTYLTEAGEALLDYARKMLALTEEAEGVLSEFRDAGSGRLLLGASNTIGIYVLPLLLRKFKERHPNVGVTLEIGNTKQVVNSVLTNRLDFGLVAGEVDHQDLKASHFLTDQLTLIVSSSHPWAGRGHVPLAEVLQEPFIIRERGASTRTVVERELSRLGHRLNAVMEVASNEAIKKAVEVGLGVSIVSEQTISQDLALGTITRLLIDDMQFKRDFYLFFHKDKFCTKTVREFLDFLATETSTS
ncbi:MAG: LysR family transcriptional regulator [Chloroflexi bacterium]|nr:LysR family transcriptional regulator [Chloroflexota bacterium]